MTKRNIFETIQLTVLGVLMFVAAVVAERRLARLFDAGSASDGRPAPA
jgi:hypothetical protein